MIRRFPLAPAEGWISVGLVLLVGLIMAWSIDDVALVLGRESFTDFLVPMAVAGTVAGFIGAKGGWGRWLTYAIGSIFAALVVPLVVGGILEPGSTPFVAYQATAVAAVRAAVDLIVLDLSVTREYGHYLWALGLLVWATAMFASYVTFGHRRPLNAIVVVGLVLLINMALTFKDQLGLLILFTMASLALLVRYHVLEEQGEWVRRRIGDPASVSGIYLRGGSIFIAAAVTGSILLTTIARSAPLEGAWFGFGQNIVEMTRAIQRILPQGGSSRSFGADFDPSGTSIAGVWNPGDQLELTVNVPPGDASHYYWRAATWDEFTLNGWRASSDAKFQIEADAPILAGSGDEADPTVTRAVTFTITPGHQSSVVFSPLTPSRVSQPVTVFALGDERRLGAVLRNGSGQYSVTALVPVSGEKPGQLNKSLLRAAGADYPEDIKRLYTTVPDGAIPVGGKAEALLKGLVAEVEVDGVLNPYDFADLLETRFKAGGPTALFTYSSNVLDLLANSCRELSTVECFAAYRRGFCQYYATTMAIFLREEGIPARVVQGFLPGQRAPSGQELIYNRLSHQWVEAYFPGIGWYTFDPTGGGLSQTVALPVGKPVPSATPRPSSSGPVASIDRGGPEVRPSGLSPGPGSGPAGSGPLIAITVMLGVVMAAAAFVVWQRGPRGGTTPDRAYRTVTRLATRFGFGPRPDQTVFEYAGTLGDVLPIARPELQTVAHAKVETAYGRGLLGEDRLRVLRLAERRLRLELLRLAFRRRRRRRR